MARGDGLGRVFNIVPTADAVEVNLVGASAVSFVLVGADTYTLNESIGAAGTPQALSCISRYSTNANANGSTAWVDFDLEAEGDPVSEIEVTAGVAVFTVRADQLTDGYTHVSVSGAATGLVTAITHDLLAGRKPSNLPPLGA